MTKEGNNVFTTVVKAKFLNFGSYPCDELHVRWREISVLQCNFVVPFCSAKTDHLLLSKKGSEEYEKKYITMARTMSY